MTKLLGQIRKLGLVQHKFKGYGAEFGIGKINRYIEFNGFRFVNDLGYHCESAGRWRMLEVMLRLFEFFYAIFCRNCKILIGVIISQSYFLSETLKMEL